MIPVIFSVMSEEDLEAIADYIANDSAARALSFVQELRKQCLDLGLFPNAYQSFPELGDNVRIMPYKNYIILYQVLKDCVYIGRVMHGARDVLRLIEDKNFP